MLIYRLLLSAPQSNITVLLDKQQPCSTKRITNTSVLDDGIKIVWFMSLLLWYKINVSTSSCCAWKVSGLNISI